jgi:hypothetical protein
MEITRSEGQGHRFSREPGRNDSIVARLHSRSLSGRSLGIGVHQHLGYRLHLVWGGRRRFSERCSEQRIERRFETYNDVSAFCEDLRALGCEGVSDWLGICSCCDFHIQNKADKCYRACTFSQKPQDDFRSS